MNDASINLDSFGGWGNTLGKLLGALKPLRDQSELVRVRILSEVGYLSVVVFAEMPDLPVLFVSDDYSPEWMFANPERAMRALGRDQKAIEELTANLDERLLLVAKRPAPVDAPRQLITFSQSFMNGEERHDLTHYVSETQAVIVDDVSYTGHGHGDVFVGTNYVQMEIRSDSPHEVCIGSVDAYIESHSEAAKGMGTVSFKSLPKIVKAFFS
ncbi:hypothetical protein F5984_20600 [Rudanella paleaurantiibacter]|uniref:Uncharacterized protein n=1 Tax=Rudanella paleaurantiibacter TaxID=2614655 RepID=A0A7J5TVG6_9BACT|nr:hypothetical protein [Rudanella paleaurantiibacter]KAB7728148.1 hypothetical protein F5984_20600 [Rudanella paleaurantiibacter]